MFVESINLPIFEFKKSLEKHSKKMLFQAYLNNRKLNFLNPDSYKSFIRERPKYRFCLILGYAN